MSLLHQIALTFLKEIGHVRAKTLVAHLGSAEAVFKTSPSQLIKIPGIGETLVGKLDFTEPLQRAEKELKFIEDNGIDVLFYTDARYPKRLKNCTDSPVLLYAKGNYNLNPLKVVSIVGTRNATDYGKHLCRQLVEELAEYNVLVASGLAHGIDVAAHKECLKNNVQTVGVLGHGLDRLYPNQNRSTADKMLLNGGLLTEYSSGTNADRQHFPERNRIVAGMADLAYSLGWEKNTEVKGGPEQLLLPIDLSVDERAVYEVIQSNKSPLAIDELAIRANMPMSQLAMILLDMELQGFIRSLPGKTYAIN